jgi:hypothetical protein
VRRREFTLYVDESIFSKALLGALAKSGETIRVVGSVVPFGAKDHEWLEIIGKKHWLALTRDQRIRYRTLEKQAVKAYAIGMFTFTGGQATSHQTAERVLAVLPKMKAIAASEPRPFIFTFGLSGPLARVRL